MNQELEFNENKRFYHVPIVTKKEMKYYLMNSKDFFSDRKEFVNKKGQLSRSENYFLYKKYRHHFLYIYDEKKVNLTKKLFNYTKPLYALTLKIKNLEEISYLRYIKVTQS